MVANVHMQERNRLIVLVPDCLAGNMDLAHQVFWMANHDQCDVLYLALVDSAENAPTIARGIATMNAMTSGESLEIQSKIAQTDLWLDTIREIYHAGDRIVCYEEQLVKKGFWKTQPISEYLNKTLGIPVITISGVYYPQRAQISRWLRGLAAWFGFLVILTCFSALEIQLNNLVDSGFGKVLLCGLVAIEIGAIYTWDRMIGS